MMSIVKGFGYRRVGIFVFSALIAQNSYATIQLNQVNLGLIGQNNLEIGSEILEDQAASPNKTFIDPSMFSFRQIKSIYDGVVAGISGSEIKANANFDGGNNNYVTTYNGAGQQTRQMSEEQYKAMMQQQIDAALAQFTTDFSANFGGNDSDKINHRDGEVDTLIEVLMRRTRNVPVMVGETGVGKTEILKGLAQRIASGNVPFALSGKRVLKLELGKIPNSAPGQQEQMLNQFFKVAKAAGNIILFVDHAEDLVPMDERYGTDLSKVFMPAIDEKDIMLIGETNQKGYNRLNENTRFSKYIQKVSITEPGNEANFQILKQKVGEIESAHGIKYEDNIFEAVLQLRKKYLATRKEPGASLEILEHTGLRVSLQSEGEAPHTVSLRDIADTIQEWSGIPISDFTLGMATSEGDQTEAEIDAFFGSRVMGQEEAKNAIKEGILKEKAGLRDPNKPMSFMFTGPTGVGKTEMTKALAAYMFGDPNAIVRIDMSEYMEKHTVSGLIGSAKGYVGYGEEGALTGPIKEKPYSVILLDEIEKAHPDVFNILLQLLDDGRLTDTSNHTVDFSNTIVVMTSNIGAKKAQKVEKNMGFEIETGEQKHLAEIKKRAAIIEEAKKEHFKPEFLNRIDESVNFHSLTMDEVAEIRDNEIAKAMQRGGIKNFDIEISDLLNQHILETGYDPEYNARGMKRAVEKLVVNSLTRPVLRGELQIGVKYTLDYDADSDKIFLRN